MRILVISDLPQFVTGGAEMQAFRLIEAWLELGHEVICLGRRMGGSSVRVGKHQIPTRRIWTLQWLGRAGRAMSYALSLTWHLMALRKWPDVIYSRFLGDAAATISMVKALGLIDVPFVATPANAGPAGDVLYLRSVPWSRWLIGLIDSRSEAINLIAPGMEEDLRVAGFTKAVLAKIPNGIPICALNAAAKSGPIRALCVGRLATQKGYDVLIDALSRMRSEHQEAFSCEVVGDGPLSRELLLAAASLPPGLLTFCGELSPDLVREKMDQVDLFVLPSRYEGMSNAGLEGMERGLPLILTRCGGLDTYLNEEHGWLVGAEDSTGLADALARAILSGRSALESKGRKCRDLVEREFAMSVISGRYINLFEGLINARRRSRT